MAKFLMAKFRSAPFLISAMLSLAVFAAGPARAQYNAPIQSAPLAPPPGTQMVPPSNIPGQVAPPPAGSAPQRPPPGAPRPGARDAFPGPTIATPPAAGTPSPAGAAADDMVIVQPPPEKVVNPTAVYAGLDKITGRITSFEVGMGETVQFGALQVTPRACYTRPPTEPTNTVSFTEVNEITLKGEAKRIFTGWMFASSPGLHGVEHPIFDVWLTDCKATPPGTAKPAGQK